MRALLALTLVACLQITSIACKKRNFEEQPESSADASSVYGEGLLGDKLYVFVEAKPLPEDMVTERRRGTPPTYSYCFYRFDQKSGVVDPKFAFENAGPAHDFYVRHTDLESIKDLVNYPLLGDSRDTALKLLWSDANASEINVQANKPATTERVDKYFKQNQEATLSTLKAILASAKKYGNPSLGRCGDRHPSVPEFTKK